MLMPAFTSLEANVRQFQFRVTLTRHAAPYQPSLISLHSTYVS